MIDNDRVRQALRRHLPEPRPRPELKRKKKRDDGSLPPPPRHNRKYISEQELHKLLEVAKEDTLDYALISLIYNAALRASEVGKLTLKHAVELPRNKFYVERVKKSRSGWLDLHPSAAQAVIAWIDACYPNRKERNRDNPLFPARRWRGAGKGGISRWAVARAMRRLCSAAGLPAEIAHPHSLRHGRVMHILEMASRTPNFHTESLVPTLAQFLGHAVAATTVNYYMNATSGALSLEQKLLSSIFDAADADADEAEE